MIKKMIMYGMFIVIAFGQCFSLDVTGTVVDEKTQEKLQGVLVKIKGTSTQIITDVNGLFSLSSGNTVSIGNGSSNLLIGKGLNRDLSKSVVGVYNIEGKRMINSLRYPGGFLRLSALLPDGIYLIEIQSKERHYLEKIVIAGNIANFNITEARNESTPRAKIAVTGPVIEAESMILNGYMLDPKYDGVRDVIMVDPNLGAGATGTATVTYTGASGIYRIKLFTCPENDGSPTLKLYINNKEILNEVLPTSSSYLRTAEKIYTVDNIAINNGDEIKIVGSSEAAAYARVDKMVLSDGLEVTLEYFKDGYITKEVETKFGQNITVELTPRSSGEKPGPGNTGYSGTLTAYTGPMTIKTPGTIIENVSISGMLTISAANVTIRNFKLNGGQYGIIGSSPGLVIEDGEIFNVTSAGYIGSNAILRRLNIHDSGGDGLKLTSNVLVEGCWIHRLGKKVDAHADGNQTRSGKNLTFRGNNFDMPSPGTPNFPGNPYKSNSNFIISTAVGPIDNILIESNWLNGGNYTIYSIDKERGYGSPTNVRVINNIFGRDNGGYPNKITGRIRTGTFAEWSGNVWEDTGELLP